MSQTKTIKYASGFELSRTYDNHHEQWTLVNNALSTADFKLDISESDNCVFEGNEDETTIEIKIESGQTDESIKIIKTIPWSFAPKFSLRETPYSYEKQREVLNNRDKSKDESEEDTQSIFKSIPYEVLDFDEIKEKMEQKGLENFIDPDFPPKEVSLYNPVAQEYPFDFVAQWRRPHEFMDDPKLFEDDIDPNDIKQGQLGD